MNKFDITFYCEDGKHKLESCAKFPSREQFEETMETIEYWLGKTKRIVIDNIS